MERQNIVNGFDRFHLRPELAQAIAGRGFSTPTLVQERVLGVDVAGRDVVVQAPTGSGKTLAFALPLLQTWSGRAEAPRALILSPTRELALQTARELSYFGRSVGAEVAALVGGMEMGLQIRQLRRGAGIVVGTPGRVLDHIRRGTVTLEKVATVVLDEGDHMLDLGFREELEAILDACPCERHTWLFSATMPDLILALAARYLKDPLRISLVDDIARHKDISHRGFLVPQGRMCEGIVNVLLAERPERALIFCRTREETGNTARFLREAGFAAGALHGEMTQRERNEALESLRSGRTPVLVATDVAARGLDVAGISHVMQIGLPGDIEAFVHRSGRTGRAGHAGCNLALVSPRDARRLKALLRSSSVDVSFVPAPDVEDISDATRARREADIFAAAEPDEDHLAWARSLIAQGDAVETVARLLQALAEREPEGYALREDLDREMESLRGSRGEGPRNVHGDRAARRPRGRQELGKATLRLSAGREHGWAVGRILRTLCSCLDVSRDEVGNIKLRGDHALVDLSPTAAARAEACRAKLQRLGLLEPERTPRRRHVA